MSVIHIESTEDFKKEVLEFDGVCIVDFRAEWCGPCRMLGPIMEDLAEDNAGKNAKIIKVNVDNNPELSQTFQISSIPAVFVMKGGKPVETIVGANPKSVYQERIDQYLAADDEVKAAA